MQLAEQPKWNAGLLPWESAGSGQHAKKSLIQLTLSGHWSPPAWAAPLYAFGADIEILFYGLLHNEADLRRQIKLQSDGSTSTADLMIAAYQRWGRDLFGRLRGEFCVIVVDHDHRVSFCARDQLGAMPVFYTDFGGQGLVISSSYDGLQLDPRVSSKLNRVAVGGWLIGIAPQKQETFFKDIARLPAGALLQKTDKTLDEIRYWMPETNSGFRNQSPADARQQFDELFTRAVKRCINAASSPGIFLSGGLDSVTVAAFANDELKRQSRKNLQAFSLEFPHPDCNERPVQERIGKTLGLEHTFCSFDKAVGPAGLLGSSLEMSKNLPVPLDNIWLGAYQSLYQSAASKNCDLILTGGGGDEWLNVSPLLCADYLRNFDFQGLERFYKAQYRSIELARFAFIRNMLWQFGIRPLLKSYLISPLEQNYPWLRRKLASRRRSRAENSIPAWLFPEKDLRNELLHRLSVPAGQPRCESFFFEDVAKSLDHALVSMQKEEQYLAGRCERLKIREPFYDADLVEMLYNIDPDILMAGGRSKALIRHIMDARFPESGFANQRKVTAINFWYDSICDQAHFHFRGLHGFGRLSALGIVDSNRLQPGFHELLNGTSNKRFRDAAKAWQLINFETWLRVVEARIN